LAAAASSQRKLEISFWTLASKLVGARPRVVGSAALRTRTALLKSLEKLVDPAAGHLVGSSKLDWGSGYKEMASTI